MLVITRVNNHVHNPMTKGVMTSLMTTVIIANQVLYNSFTIVIYIYFRNTNFLGPI